MTELRQDPTSRNWVILAPERSLRPHDHAAPRRVPSAVGCPFCPGREAETPAELWRLAGPDGSWRIRVVPNKFPVLHDDVPADRENRDGFHRMAGHGQHEVLIESPRHDWDLASGSQTEVRDVLAAYRERYRALRTASDAAVIVVFRNHGLGSGTSLDHPHSQLVAAPVVPPQVRRRLDVARAHADDLGTCLYLDLVERELADGRRIISAGERLVSFQPYAAAAAYETWIVPRFHQSSFGSIDDATLDELAETLRRVLLALCHHLDDPPYNLVVHSPPLGDEQRAYFTWYLQIVPRLSTPAGFELATGIPINPSLPEETAAELRGALAHL